MANANNGSQQPIWEPLQFTRYPTEEMKHRARAFYDELRQRRTVRMFSDQSVEHEVIADCLRAAGAAPSGANLQPWHFVVAMQPEVKRQIRLAAEQEERDFYDSRAPAEWLRALAPLGTDANKAFLETAPVLIAIFAQRYGQLPDGNRVKHYYVAESVGIATGFLIAALHHAGLATLTHTPSPMGFLNDILGRSANEKPYLLLVTGYPAKDCVVPQAGGIKKPLEEFTTWLSASS